jgi:GNAT superfamily N-acetyltransferase
MSRSSRPSGSGRWLPGLGAFEATLRDGRRVRVRQITADDRGRFVAGLRRMSPRSRYLRFHRLVTDLTDAELRLLAEPDQRLHRAWGALAMDEPGEPGVGVARYIRDGDDPTQAEFALTVVDDFQGAGLGRLLLETIIADALRHGVERLTAPVLAENTAALRLFERLGGRLRREREDEVTVEIPVTNEQRPWKVSQPMLPALPPDQRRSA